MRIAPLIAPATASFTTVALGDSLGEAQLALDAAGHPGVLLTAEGSDSIQQYIYSECNARCTELYYLTCNTNCLPLAN